MRHTEVFDVSSIVAMIVHEFENGKSACLELCATISDEINKDLLHVDTKTITHDREFSTKSTVRRF